MEIKQRKSVNDKLSKYDYLVNKDSDDFIEVTEWTNGEGFDIGFADEVISLSRGKLDAINYLTQTLDYDASKTILK